MRLTKPTTRSNLSWLAIDPHRKTISAVGSSGTPASSIPASFLSSPPWRGRPNTSSHCRVTPAPATSGSQGPRWRSIRTAYLATHSLPTPSVLRRVLMSRTIASNDAAAGESRNKPQNRLNCGMEIAYHFGYMSLLDFRFESNPAFGLKVTWQRAKGFV